MKIILLEKVEKLGSLGDQVEVRNGYARNYLLPTGRALRATDENIKYFEEKASDLKKKNNEDVKEEPWKRGKKGMNKKEGKEGPWKRGKRTMKNKEGKEAPWKRGKTKPEQMKMG